MAKINVICLADEISSQISVALLSFKLGDLNLLCFVYVSGHGSLERCFIFLRQKWLITVALEM